MFVVTFEMNRIRYLQMNNLNPSIERLERMKEPTNWISLSISRIQSILARKWKEKHSKNEHLSPTNNEIHSPMNFTQVWVLGTKYRVV